MGFIEDAKAKAEELLKSGQDKAADATDTVKGETGDITDVVEEKAADVKGDVSDAVDAGKEKLAEAAEAVGNFIDEKTDGKYADKVDAVQDFIKDHTK